MSQINIYVPDDLKAQLAQHPELKLSAIASQAFRRALADIAKKRRVTPAPYAATMPETLWERANR